MEATLAELRRRLVESQEVADELTIMLESRACSRSVQLHRHIEEAIEKVEARIEKLGHTLARLEGGDLGQGEPDEISRLEVTLRRSKGPSWGDRLLLKSDDGRIDLDLDMDRRGQANPFPARVGRHSSQPEAHWEARRNLFEDPITFTVDVPGRPRLTEVCLYRSEREVYGDVLDLQFEDGLLLRRAVDDNGSSWPVPPEWDPRSSYAAKYAVARHRP